jgi:hypothetical protein
MKRRTPALAVIALGLVAFHVDAARAQACSYWGPQLQGGYSPTSTAHVASGDSNPGLATADLDLQWDLAPGYQFVRQPLFGYSALGARYFLLDDVFLDFDTRYRYVSKLVSDYGQSLDTVDTTLSLRYRF